jgi:hypothetical protein
LRFNGSIRAAVFRLGVPDVLAAFFFAGLADFAVAFGFAIIRADFFPAFAFFFAAFAMSKLSSVSASRATLTHCHGVAHSHSFA